MLLCVPLFSRDVYAYIGQGRLMLEGMNPYEQGISALPNYYRLGPDLMWTEAPVPYGQLFLWMASIAVGLTVVQPELSILLLRLASVIGVVLSAYYIHRLTVHVRGYPARTLWLTAANPLFLTNFIASAHNDSLMVGLALAGLYYCLKGSAIRGVALATLAISIKPIALIFLPFIGLIWAGRRAGWSRKLFYWASTATMSFSFLALLGWMAGIGFGWINGIFDRGSLWIWYAPVGLAGGIAAAAGNLLELDGGQLMSWVHRLGKIASLVIVVWQILRGSYDRLLHRLAIALAAVVLLSPMIQSWWVLWFLPLLAVIGIRDGGQTKAVYIVTIFFMVYAISDQLDVFPYMHPENLAWPLAIARILAATLSLSAGLWLVFFDPRTKHMFHSHHQQASRRLQSQPTGTDYRA
ncbi:polyprenol phosphomannose-dependent alpha 1,6 mannosyltransferase MptB [Crystallibacter crystallopoietes]|uniref:polyprenol phosphomannose-dependent alpha 1,6 mannosyltransferase MptB n=1 Tax=Crystallibacter crystallopoietes TaxID=37928 RepID=UPI001ED9C662|nr:polyprenol phosphomannose-dependent alpha 1,6 mannosyltransferase MptB [Arthrobacter crystallopoietes]